MKAIAAGELGGRPDDYEVAGERVFRHERRWGVRDHYVLEVRPDRLDPRLAIALAICLDALQSR